MNINFMVVVKEMEMNVLNKLNAANNLKRKNFKIYYSHWTLVHSSVSFRNNDY